TCCHTVDRCFVPYALWKESYLLPAGVVNALSSAFDSVQGWFSGNYMSYLLLAGVVIIPLTRSKDISC
ncbi:hypothetical protein Ancab_038994, partial [Ancistrocladus abbreviatus]